jgi:hypothetical protein
MYEMNLLIFLRAQHKEKFFKASESKSVLRNKLFLHLCLLSVAKNSKFTFECLNDYLVESNLRIVNKSLETLNCFKSVDQYKDLCNLCNLTFQSSDSSKQERYLCM